MQFAGQRTDENFKPIGEPDNWLIKLTDEILPDPDAVLITGITPQKTLEEGYSEAEFLKLFNENVCQPDTIILGFNSIRFDDEFMRYTLWRNFYDAYEWQWQDGRSRWDLLDVARMVRTLRPEGIEWPVDDKGQPTNRLELLTKANKLDHQNAHDALSDVYATIEVAKLLKQKQPQMFDYLLKMRDKNEVKKLVNLDDKNPFVYTSGRYDAEYEKTTVAFPLTAGKNGNVVVYDLRYDPTDFVSLSEKEVSGKLFAGWEERKKEDFVKLPVKQLQYNHCPAVAPLGVLTQNDGWKKIQLDEATIQKNLKTLLTHPDFAERVRSAFETKPDFKTEPDVDFQLYDGFVGDSDKAKMKVVRAADVNVLADTTPGFVDERLSKLLPRYKARNFLKTLSETEQTDWERYRHERLAKGLTGQLSIEKYMSRLQELAVLKQADDRAEFLLQELQLWAENIAPMAEQ